MMNPYPVPLIVAVGASLAGCTWVCPPRIEYRPLPAAMIPARLTVPTVKEEEFRSVPGSDDLLISRDVYGRLARRNWLYEKHVAELRALLGGRLMDDDPDSLRTYDERAARDELREMRRTADRSREEQIYLLTGSVGAIKVDIADLKRALADHVGPGEEALINRAATRAVELVFANIGVDVNDPKDLQRFRDDLRFGAMIRTASQKA
ncbi:MAG: hypothetical protein IPN66_06900 [Candidatus Competibacteraceae bacterium]|nr:hypothetical protein [Candidatus Competibacteraceae bacterium]